MTEIAFKLELSSIQAHRIACTNHYGSKDNDQRQSEHNNDSDPRLIPDDHKSVIILVGIQLSPINQRPPTQLMYQKMFHSQTHVLV